MGEAGAGDQEMRRIGMIQRRQHPSLRQGGANVDAVTESQALSHGFQGQFPGNGAARQFECRGDALDHLALGIITSTATARPPSWARNCTSRIMKLPETILDRHTSRETRFCRNPALLSRASHTIRPRHATL